MNCLPSLQPYRYLCVYCVCSALAIPRYDYDIFSVCFRLGNQRNTIRMESNFRNETDFEWKQQQLEITAKFNNKYFSIFSANSFLPFSTRTISDRLLTICAVKG